MRRRLGLALTLIALMVGATAGCSGSGEPAESTQATQVRPPVMVDPERADGETFAVPLDSSLVILSGDADVSAWQGSAQDPSVAEFTPGRSDGEATYNPGFKPLSEGSTKVMLTHDKTGESLAFTITVTPATGATSGS